MKTKDAKKKKKKETCLTSPYEKIETQFCSYIVVSLEDSGA